MSYCYKYYKDYSQKALLEKYRGQTSTTDIARRKFSLKTKFCYKNTCVWGRREGGIMYCPFTKCWKGEQDG